MTLIGRDRRVLECTDLPTCDNGLTSGSMKRWLDVDGLQDLLREWSARHDLAREDVTAVIERPFAMPSLPAQTIASQFDTVGALRAVLASRAKVQMVTPSEWKRLFAIGTDKDKAREVAASLYPDAAHFFKRARDHNRAESCLVGHWYLKVKA